nr:hypothetical protein BaRGS_011776 [Batillaria attramentaria]
MPVGVGEGASQDVSSKPISVDDTLLDIVSKALDGGSDKDKAESISLVLELLAQIDLPTLCKSIAADASEYTRVDDIIARAASTYDVTPAATEQLGDEDLSESEQDAVNVTQGTEPLTQTEATAAEKHKAPQLLADPDDNQVFQDNIFPEELQNIVDSYNYVNDLDPNGPEYSADSLYNDMLYPRDQIYDYYDLSDNLIYDVVAAAAAAGPKGNNKNIWPDPEGNDNKVFPWLEPKDMKDENLWLDPEDKDAAALFFPEGLLAFSAFAAQEQPGKDEEVFIQGSESVKPEQALSAENLRLEMTEEDDNDDNDTSSGSQTDSVDAVTTAPSLTVSTTSEDVTTGAANTTDELDADNDASDFLTTLASLLFSTTDAPTAVSEEETKNEENMDENDSEEMEDSDESSEEISTYAPESETTETTNTPSNTTQKEQKAKEAKKIVHPYKTRSEDGEMRVMADPSEKKARAELNISTINNNTDKSVPDNNNNDDINNNDNHYNSTIHRENNGRQLTDPLPYPEDC